MIQQQIVDYARAQLKLGVSRAVVKSTLLGAGWAEADIEDSLKGFDATELPKIEEKKMQISGLNPTIMISDLVADSKVQPMPSGRVDSVAKKIEPKIETSRSPVSNRLGMPKSGKTILTIALAVLALGAAGGAVYFYLQNRGLQRKLADLSSQIDAANTKMLSLTSQVTDLANQKHDLVSGVISLTDENKMLASKLSFFFAPANVSSSEAAEFVFKGILAGGGKALYAVISDDGIKISVKNSKDEKVNAALTNLVGKIVSIGGTHLPGSKDVTVTSVNGAQVR